MKKKDKVFGRSWKFYDDIARFYDSQYEEPYWKLYHLVTEKLIESLIEKHFEGRSGLSVLDLGSGTGFWAEYFLLGENRTATVKAVTDLRVIKIPNAEIPNFLNQFPC